jgi:hypothetical protein
MVEKESNYMWKVNSILVIILLVISGLLIALPSSLDNNSIEAASTWNSETDSDFNNGTCVNTTIEGTEKSAKIMLDLSDLNHWTEKTLSTKPSQRRAHDMATIWGSDKILLFGGIQPASDETWIYDLSDGKWSQQLPNTKPSRKSWHNMASLWGTDKVLLFSGVPLNNETWVYDLSDNNWTLLSQTNAPSTRRYTAMASVHGDDKVVLFGGWWNLDDTWVFDFSDGKWTQKLPGNKPTARYYHAMASIDGTDKVLLYGGWPNSITDETWVYDLSDNNWTQKLPATKPGRRYFHAMDCIWGTDRVVTFGGYPNPQFTNETWVYDLSDDTWTKEIIRNPANNPVGRAIHALASFWKTDRAVLFGGVSIGAINDDTWLYKHFLRAKNGTYISVPYDTRTNSSFDSLNWDCNMQPDTTLKFQLRTANSKKNLTSKAFVGPDGSTEKFYTTCPAQIWSGHYKDRWVQYKAFFNISIVTDSPELNKVSIAYNCLPKTIVIDPYDGSLISTDKPTFKWTFDDMDCTSQKGFQILIDDDINLTELDYDSGIQITEDEYWEFPTGTNYSSIPDGTWYWTIRTMDADGAWSDYSKSRLLRIDSVLPTSATTFPVNNGFYKDVDEITGIASEQVIFSGLNKVEISIKRLIDNNFWNGSAWIPLTAWLLAQGTEEWSYDSSEIQWTSGLRYTIQSRAVDNALNIEVPEIQNMFTIDTETPESTIDYPIDHNWINKLNEISGTAVDIGSSDVRKVEICIRCTKDSVQFDGGGRENECWNGNDWKSTEAWLSTTGTNEWHYNSSKIPFKTGDHYVIHSRAVDNTDNIELPGSGTTFLYDASPPDPVSIFINNGEEYTKYKLVTLSLAAEDLGSGVSKMAFSTDSAVWSNWEPFNTTRSFDLSSGDGEKTIYFKAKDFTGNIAESVLDEIFLDTTPPHELSIVINEGAEFTSSKQIKLDFTATDLGSGVHEISYSFDGYNWAPWEGFMNTKFISLGTGDGERHIYYKARDKVGNSADPVSDSIILDTIPPYSLSIKINNGAAEINSTTAKLDLRALDNLSGVSEIAFSLDGETWSNWEDYSNSRSFELPIGNGIKTVYFMAKDKVGNVAEPVSASILMNITTPESNTEISRISSGPEIWNYFILIIIIILIFIITALVIIIRKRKRAEPEIIPMGAVTIRPQEHIGPAPSVQQVSTTTQYPQLGGTPTVSVTPTPAVAPAPTPIPILVKSTQTAQPSIASQPTPQVVPQPVPQLPPAQVQVVRTPQPTVAPKPTLAPTPTIQQSLKPTISGPTPTVVQPTVATSPTPTLASPPETTNGPAVHLPGIPSSTPTENPGQPKQKTEMQE